MSKRDDFTATLCWILLAVIAIALIYINSSVVY